MKYLISYDIEDNKKRKKISDFLIEYSFIRIQKSVFIGDISEKKQQELSNKIISYLAKSKYSLFVSGLEKDNLYEDEELSTKNKEISNNEYFIIL